MSKPSTQLPDGDRIMVGFASMFGYVLSITDDSPLMIPLNAVIDVIAAHMSFSGLVILSGVDRSVSAPDFTEMCEIPVRCIYS